MRLIDVEALIEKHSWTLYNWNEVVDVEELMKAPVIDAKPVVYGVWIDHEPFDNGNDNCNKCIECSVCKTWFGHDCYAKTNYCPNCGAYMGWKRYD